MTVSPIRPPIDRQAEAERLAECLMAAISDRCAIVHRRADIDVCTDPICSTAADLRRVVG